MRMKRNGGRLVRLLTMLWTVIIYRVKTSKSSQKRAKAKAVSLKRPQQRSKLLKNQSQFLLSKPKLSDLISRRRIKSKRNLSTYYP